MQIRGKKSSQKYIFQTNQEKQKIISRKKEKYHCKANQITHKAIKMLAMSSLMMPVPMLGGQLVHKPPEAKLLAIHSAAAHNQQHQATPQHHMQQTIHLQQPQQQLHQQQMQQQQSKPGSRALTC